MDVRQAISLRRTVRAYAQDPVSDITASALPSTGAKESAMRFVPSLPGHVIGVGRTAELK